MATFDKELLENAVNGAVQTLVDEITSGFAQPSEIAEIIGNQINNLPKVTLAGRIKFEEMDADGWYKFLCLTYQYINTTPFSKNKAIHPVLDTKNPKEVKYSFRDVVPGITARNFAALMAALTDNPQIYDDYVKWSQDKKKEKLGRTSSTFFKHEELYSTSGRGRTFTTSGRGRGSPIVRTSERIENIPPLATMEIEDVVRRDAEENAAREAETARLLENAAREGELNRAIVNVANRANEPNRAVINEQNRPTGTANPIINQNVLPVVQNPIIPAEQGQIGNPNIGNQQNPNLQGQADIGDNETIEEGEDRTITR